MALHSFLGSSELQAITLQTTELFALQLVGVCCRCCCLLLVVVVCCWLSLFIVVAVCRYLLFFVVAVVCWRSLSLLLVVVVVCSCRCFCVFLFLSSLLFFYFNWTRPTGFFYIKCHESNENPAASNGGSTYNLCQSWLSLLPTLHPKYLFSITY